MKKSIFGLVSVVLIILLEPILLSCSLLVIEGFIYPNSSTEPFQLSLGISLGALFLLVYLIKLGINITRKYSDKSKINSSLRMFYISLVVWPIFCYVILYLLFMSILRAGLSG